MAVGCALVTSLAGQQSLETEYRMTGRAVVAAFEAQRAVLQTSSALILDGREEAGYGVVISPQGHILAKASEFLAMKTPSITVDRTNFSEVSVLAEDLEWDVVLLKIAATDLIPVVFAATSDVPQGTWVAAGGPSRIQVWNYTNASKQIEMENTNGLSVLSMEISENGSLVAAALDDLSIRVWNATTGKELARLYGHTSKITELLFTPNLEFLISGALDGTVRIWGIK